MTTLAGEGRSKHTRGKKTANLSTEEEAVGELEGFWRFTEYTAGNVHTNLEGTDAPSCSTTRNQHLFHTHTHIMSESEQSQHILLVDTFKELENLFACKLNCISAQFLIPSVQLCTEMICSQKGWAFKGQTKRPDNNNLSFHLNKVINFTVI